MYQEILELIKKYETIIIHRHKRPDGDALGCQIGLKETLQATYKKKKIYAVGDMIERYRFIGEMDTIHDEVYQNSLVFVLDSAEEVLVCDERYKLASKVVKIDHHISRSNFGDLNIVDTSFESCAGLIAEIALKLKLKINVQAATALLTGMITDSGRFRYDSTSPRTLEIAAKLLSKGVDLNEIYNYLYTEELDMVKLRAYFTLNFKVTEQSVAYMMNQKEDIVRHNTDFFTISRGMVNTMAGIKGIDVWANFTEDENGKVIAELRSSKYNINQVAVKYGGGGHEKASGATLNSFEEAYLMLADLDRVIKKEYNMTEGEEG